MKKKLSGLVHNPVNDFSIMAFQEKGVRAYKESITPSLLCLREFHQTNVFSLPGFSSSSLGVCSSKVSSALV